MASANAYPYFPFKLTAMLKKHRCRHLATRQTLESCRLVVNAPGDNQGRGFLRKGIEIRLADPDAIRRLCRQLDTLR